MQPVTELSITKFACWSDVPKRSKLGLFALLFLSAFQPIAGQAAAPDREGTGVFTVVVENDLFARTDQSYTSGVRASWVTSPQNTPSWALSLARRIPLFADWGVVRTEYAIQQAIFTPADTRRVIPDPLDRPYAGWLNASIGLIGETGSLLDQLSLSLGVVGPSSLARESQRLVHDIRGIDSPQRLGLSIAERAGGPAIVSEKLARGRRVCL
jgi:hypothetical protein